MFMLANRRAQKQESLRRDAKVEPSPDSQQQEPAGNRSQVPDPGPLFAIPSLHPQLTLVSVFIRRYTNILKNVRI